VEYDFTNDLSTGETLDSCTATITDNAGNDVTSSMLSGKSVSTPDVTFTIQKGTPDSTYQIKLAGVSSAGSIYVHYITCEVFGTLSIVTKIGDSTSNSYVTLEEANDYIRNKYGHANKWDILTDEGKKRLLIESTREMSAFNFL